jgi:hypothetical protein
LCKVMSLLSEYYPGRIAEGRPPSLPFDGWLHVADEPAATANAWSAALRPSRVSILACLPGFLGDDDKSTGEIM